MSRPTAPSAPWRRWKPGCPDATGWTSIACWCRSASTSAPVPGRVAAPARCSTCAGRPGLPITVDGGRRLLLQRPEPGEGIGRVAAAHVRRRLEAAADRRPLRPPEQPAAVVVGELHAADTGRLAERHARYR